MRWNQLINESLSKYRPMFTGLFAGGKVPRDVEMEIQKIERIMQREDRVIWMLRWYRAGLAFELNGMGGADTTPEVRKVLDRVKRDLVAKGNTIDDHNTINQSDRAINALDDFEHYFSMPIEGIKRLVFDRQYPADILAEFEGFEEEWKDNIGENSVEIESGDEKIIDFGNGWAWWHLDRPYCDAEGKAMGHCGNSAAYKSDDTLLSLREHTHGDMWEPHCTFILDGDHYLGEMKGKGNEKPVERYHSMILALLEDDIVYGIKGGGYAPENNFSLSDLPMEDQQRLKKTKPGLQTIAELLRDGDTEGAEKVVKRLMSSRGWSYRKIDMEKKEITLDTWTGVESLANQYVDNYNNAFNEVRDELIRESDEGESIYEQFYNDYYAQIMDDHIHDFVRFKCDVGFDFNGPGGTVTMSISLSSFETAVEGDEDYGYGQVNDLDEIEDYHSWSDSDPNYNDDIDESMCEFIAEGRKSQGLSHIAQLVTRTYGDSASKHSFGSPTVNDPRQGRFDF